MIAEHLHASDLCRNRGEDGPGSLANNRAGCKQEQVPLRGVGSRSVAWLSRTSTAERVSLQRVSPNFTSVFLICIFRVWETFRGSNIHRLGKLSLVRSCGIALTNHNGLDLCH